MYNFKNLTTKPLSLDTLGIILQPLESRDFLSVANRGVISMNGEIFTSLIYSDSIIVTDVDGNYFSKEESVLIIVDAYNKVEIINSELEVNIGDITIEYNKGSNEYYYFGKQFALKPSEKYVFHFKGHLKSCKFEIHGGNILINIANMGQISLEDDEVFDFDYQLKDPLIEITSTKLSTFQIFVEGIYIDAIKPKPQYLYELNTTLSMPNIPDDDHDNELIFSTKLNEIVDGVFFDKIGYKTSVPTNISTNFLVDGIFKDSMYASWGDIMNIDDNKEYTISLWFKVHELSNTSQYLLHNKNEYYLRLSNKDLYFYGFGKSAKLIDDIEAGRYYNFIATFVDGDWKCFVDGNFVNQVIGRTHKMNTGDLYTGYNNSPLKSVELDAMKIYNYAFSSSMIEYLVQHQNPNIIDDIINNYENGAVVNYYECMNITTPEDSYEFTIIEKEHTKFSKMIGTNGIAYIDSSLSSKPTMQNYLSVIEGKIYIPQSGVYYFSVDGNDSVEFLIDEVSVVSWLGEHMASFDNMHYNTKYLEQGYYSYKFRHIEIYDSANIGSYKLSWRKPSDVEYEIVPTTNFFKLKTKSNTADGVFGMLNNSSYGVTITNHNASLSTVNSVMSYNITNGNYIDLSPIPQSVYDNTFTYNTWFYTSSNYNWLFTLGGGEDWNHYMSITTDEKNILNFNFCDKRVSSKKNAYINSVWNMLTITTSGTKIYIYINGEEVAKVDNIQNDWYKLTNPKILFGALGSGTISNWMKTTDFNISGFTFYDIFSTKDNIIESYEQQKSKYGL
jgi:hypothetical protein